MPSINHGNIDNRLYAVEAIAPDAVWTTGTDDAGFASRSLFLKWDGTQWTEVQGPNPTSQDNYFFSLEAVSTTDAWAMGHYGNSTSSALMFARLNGNVWSQVPAPSVPASLDYRYGDLAEISGSDVWAVSYQAGTQVTTTVTLRWNGTSWSTVPSPNVGSFTNFLSGVAAPASNDVWAGGAYSDGSAYRTLTMRWDGAQWTVVPSPNVGAGDNAIYRMSAASPNSVWAVGHYMESASIIRTLALHWDGAQWNITQSQNPGASNRFSDVEALAPNDVWAVGRQVTAGGTSQTLIEHWDGAQWITVPSPNLSTTFNDLTSISAISPTDIWAAGHYRAANNIFRTLVLRYNDPCGGTVTPTASPSAVATSVIPTSTSAPSSTATSVSTSTFTPSVTTQAATQTPTQAATAVSSHTPTAAPSSTAVPSTATATETVMPPATATPAQSSTPASTAPPATQTPPACTISFTDVPEGHTFYQFVRCLACRGLLGGYGDGTFRPNNDITRGQLSKIVANAAGFNEPISGQSFSDVPPGHTFYEYIERLARRGLIGGYNDDTFRPGNNATRGQLSKIVSNAAGYVEPATGQFYADVDGSNPFYNEIMRLTVRGVMSGYPCGGEGEPCDSQNRPYFRWGNNVTRGQAAKIVANTFYPGCQ
ncbi:MAG TPA: S-layer homology domain-containing protein [Chloroflexia bacterium]|nr:S-layer homology domain-containing protein [Chloroflexia bacterium]